MNYTNFTLIGLGILGVFFHCLVELNKINKANNGKDITLALKNYFTLEVFSLLLSVSVVIGCGIISTEVYNALDKIGYGWITGGAYMAIGYSAQSVLFFFIGKANKTIGNENTTTDNTNNPS